MTMPTPGAVHRFSKRRPGHRHGARPTGPPRPGWRLTLSAVCAATLAAGCQPTPEIDLQRELDRAREQLEAKDRQLAARQSALDDCNKLLTTARAFTPDQLSKIIYPERVQIGTLSGGYSEEGRPGDEGVVVYLQPIDADDDILKVAGDIRIELFDLQMPPGQNQIGVCYYPADKVRKLWYGQLATNHFTLKCAFSTPPKHTEITVRATFVDYLTQRVMTDQKVVTIKLPPGAAPTP